MAFFEFEGTFRLSVTLNRRLEIAIIIRIVELGKNNQYIQLMVGSNNDSHWFILWKGLSLEQLRKKIIECIQEVFGIQIGVGLEVDFQLS